jgi:hypothetical protein
MKDVQGQLQYASGAPVNGGKVSFALQGASNYHGVSIFVDPSPVIMTIQSDGTFSGELLASDEVVPVTPYVVTVCDASGKFLAKWNQVIAGTSPISVTAFTPIQIAGEVFPPQYTGLVQNGPKIIEGKFVTGDGSTPVANGTVTFTLSQQALVGQSQLIPTPIVVSLDSDGNLPSNFKMWGNDVMAPDTVYLVTVRDANGKKLSNVTYSIAGGTSISLNQLVQADVAGISYNSSPQQYWKSYQWKKVPETIGDTSLSFPPFSSTDIFNSGVLEGSFNFVATANGGGGSASDITSWSLVSNIVTFQAVNNFAAGSVLFIEDLVAGSFLNTQNAGYLVVKSSGLSGTQFECDFVHADASATEFGVVFYGAEPTLTLSWVDPMMGNQTTTLFSSIASITSWEITNNVVTFQADNTYVKDMAIVVQGLSSGSFLNNVANLFVMSATATEFSCAFTHANASASESGTAIAPFDEFGGDGQSRTLVQSINVKAGTAVSVGVTPVPGSGAGGSLSVSLEYTGN